MNITDHITASGKTRVAISEQAGVSRQTLHKVETGKARPKIEVAIAIAQAIGCPLSVVRPDLQGLLA